MYLSLPKILVIAVIVIALFGYKKFPEIGKSLARGLTNFRKALNEPDEIDVTPKKNEKAEAENAAAREDKKA